MMQITLRFRECEHEGDLEDYAQDVGRCGGSIVGSELNSDAETGALYVQFRNEAEQSRFFDQFRHTDSFDFCS